MGRSLAYILAGSAIAFLFASGLSLFGGLVLSHERLVAVLRAAFLADEFSAVRFPLQETFSECAILHMQYFRARNVFLNAIDSYWIRPGELTCTTLEGLLGLGRLAGAQFGAPTSYPNYPFGARYLLAPVLSVMEFSSARMLYRIVSYGSVVILAVGAFRNSRATAIVLLPLWLILLFGFGLPVYGENVLHAPGYFAGFILLAIMLWARDWFALWQRRLFLFALLGGITTYFDGLTGSIPANIFLAVLLNHLFYVRRLAGTLTSRRYLLRAGMEVAAVLASFGLAYLLFALTRIGLRSFVYAGEFSNLLHGIAHRTGAVAEGHGAITILDLPQKLWVERLILTGSDESATALMVCAAIGWMVAIGTVPVLWARRQFRSLTDLLVVASCAFLIVGWYGLFLNHTYIHAWFMVRLFALIAATGFVAAAFALMQVRAGSVDKSAASTSQPVALPQPHDEETGCRAA